MPGIVQELEQSWDANGEQLPVETQERIRRGADLIKRAVRPRVSRTFTALGEQFTMQVPEHMQGKRVRVSLECLE